MGGVDETEKGAVEQGRLLLKKPYSKQQLDGALVKAADVLLRTRDHQCGVAHQIGQSDNVARVERKV